MTVKINLIRHYISSHSFNYKEKLGVRRRELGVRTETDDWTL